MSHEVAQSGFFPNEVLGHLRPSAQIIQWNIAAPDPSGRRHVESGSYRKTAHLQNVGGFTAQRESGVALDYGDIPIPGGGSGFQTDTIAITFNMGDLNSNPNSRFDQLFNEGSGTGSADLTAFNFRMWIGNLNAFNNVAYSGAQKDPVPVKPVFWYRESAQWRKGYKLEFTDSSGVQISGVSIAPSSMPDCPNVFVREDEVMTSGAYLDREFSNFVYMRGNFPDLPSGQFYKLGTYGGLGLGTFTTKFSYDYTRKDSNILVPTDVCDFALSVQKGFPLQTLNEGLSGWWQMNEASPKLSQVSGWQVDDGYPFGETVMTLAEVVEGGGSVGRHTGIVSSGTASGWAMNLRSNRRDQVYTSNTHPQTMTFDGDGTDGHTGFTFTGWFCPNDPSGVDPAATGVGARIPSLDTGILCRWNFRFSLQALHFRLWYSRSVGRILGQFNMEDFRAPLLPYNYMSVDAQENGHWSSDGPGGGGQIDGDGGGLGKHEWYFICFGHDPNGEGSPAGDMFLRINDGPIERQPVSASIRGLDDTDGSTASPPFSIGSFFTRTAGNGSIGPGAGQYDNWTLHRRPLTNREMTDLYNTGFGQEYPAGRDRVINFDLPPEQAIVDIDPDPVPLRRTLKAFYNFSEASGNLRVTDVQRYTDLIPNNSQIAAGAISGNFMPTSGIVVDSMPVFDDLASASGALQIRSSTGTFDDGQPGNNVWWEAGTPSQMAAIGDTEMTMACWVRFKSGGGTEPIMGQWTAAGNNRYWVLLKLSSNHIVLGRANGTTIGQPSNISTPAQFATDFTPNRWYFVFVTNEMTGGLGSSESTWSLNVHDPITGETYTGTQVSTFQWADVNNSVPITIGAYETLGTAVVADADFAGAGMWRRKLSASEISSLINSGNGLNFGASNFGRITRNYWDSQKKRDGDPSAF